MTRASRLALTLVLTPVFLFAADLQKLRTLNQNLHESTGRRLPPALDTLTSRAALLRAAIRENPAAARGFLLEPSLLASLAQTSSAAKASLESPASYLAEDVTIVDSSDWRTAWYVYHLSTPEGPLTAYQDSQAGAHPACNTRMQIEGYRLGDTMLVTNATVVGKVDHPACSTLGDQKSAVILVSFPKTPISKLTVEQYKTTFFSDTAPSANDFYREMSYGKASVSGDVFGPYTLTRDYDSCADSDTVAAQALALADAAVDLTPYNRVFIIAPPPTTCGFGGYGNVGCATYLLAKAGPLRLSQVYEFDAAATEILRVAPHELGHGLGLSHARTDALSGEPLGPDRTRMTYSEYADAYSSMGGSGPHHFAAPHKVTLQWLESDETAVITADQTADLLPMSSPTHGLKGLRVERRVGSKQYVWIEYRTPTGYDSSLAPNLLGGALIHFEDPQTGGYTELLNYGAAFTTAELRAGATWHDPYSDLTIQALEATPDHLRVSVRHDPLCTSTSFPTTSTYGSDAFTLLASVTPSTCDWTTTGNNFWLQPQPFSAGDSAVNFLAASNDDSVSRQGSVTAGRQTFFVTQSPVMRPLAVGYFGPAQATATSTPFEIGVSLPNTTATLGSVDILWNGDTSFTGGCAITYDFATRRARMFDNSGVPLATTISASSTLSLSNTICSVGGLRDVRTTPFFSNLFFTWLPRVAPAQALNVYYRFRTTPEAAPGDWQQGGTVALAQCPVYADTSLLTPASTGGTYVIGVTAASSCAWTVSTDADWITASPASGTGTARISVTVGANSTASNRPATLNIGPLALPVQQFSSQSAAVPFVSFSQSELDVARIASSTTLQFSTSLRDGGISWQSSSPWLRVTGYQVSVAGCPCVTVSWTSNLSELSRQATLTGALLDGTVVPGTTLHVVQDSGRLRPEDYQFTTAAGADTTIDGMPALSAVLRQPHGVAIDAEGGIVTAEFDGHRIRRIAPDGSISTLAGTGLGASTPNAGPARQVGVFQPEGLTYDASGNLYIVSNNQIRMLNPDGNVSVVVGSGSFSFSGDGGPATRAGVEYPSAIAIAPDNTLYFTDTYNHRVRKVSPDGVISTIAGTGTAGYAGEDGPATAARLNFPWGIATAPDSSLLIADRSNNRIRRITADGKISLVAGTGTCGSTGDAGPALKALICAPTQLAVDAEGNIFIADTSNGRIRKISPDGIISTVAGNGALVTANDSGPSTTTPIGASYGIAVSPSGDIYISDATANRVRVVRNGTVSPIAGAGNPQPAGDGAAALSAQFYRPYGMALDAAGNLFISDNATHRVRKVAPDGTITAFAGNGTNTVGGDGKAAVSAGLFSPNGIATAPDGTVYIGSYCQVRKVDTAGVITVHAGSGTCGFADNDAAAKAQFSNVAGIALDASGNLYVADPNNQRVRKVASDGAVTTIAGNGKTGAPVDGPAVDSPLNGPTDVTVDAAGNLYIADKASYSIRKVTPDGVGSNFAGTPRSFGYTGDTGPADRARFGLLQSAKMDSTGTLWIADTTYHVIRKITPDGIIGTVAGTGSAGAAGTDGPAWASPLNAPYGLAIGPNGVYVADSANGRVRLLVPVPPR